MRKPIRTLTSDNDVELLQARECTLQQFDITSRNFDSHEARRVAYNDATRRLLIRQT
jgi:hypothetical protein